MNQVKDGTKLEDGPCHGQLIDQNKLAKTEILEYKTAGRILSVAQGMDLSRRKRPLCEYCHSKKAIKTDSESKWICESCLKGVRQDDGTIKRLEPYKNPNPVFRRNGPCPCGSKKKFKKCCMRPLKQGGPVEANEEQARQEELNGQMG